MRFAVYVDAQLVSVTTASECILPSLAPGTHNIAVVAISETANPYAIRPEWEEGDQALLTWTRVEDAELQSYKVLDTVTNDEITVETVRIPQVTVSSSTGGGTGRLSIGGVFSGGETVNGDLLLTVLAANRLSYAIEDFTGEVPISRRGTVQLPFGAAITFLDFPSYYAVGATYRVPLYVATEQITGVLDRGTRTFEVRSVTEQGISSEPTTATVFVPAPKVEGVFTLGVNGGLPELTYLLSGIHAAGVRVYTNWCGVTSTFLELIDEVSAAASDTGLSGAIALPWDEVTEGTLRVTVGMETTFGTVVIDRGVLELGLPVPPVMFGTVEILEVVQRGTAIYIRAAYTAAAGDGATELTFERSGASGTASEDVAFTPGEAAEITGLESTLTAAGADGETVTVTVTPAAGAETGTAAMAEVVLDLHEPDAPGASSGVPA